MPSKSKFKVLSIHAFFLVIFSGCKLDLLGFLPDPPSVPDPCSQHHAPEGCWAPKEEWYVSTFENEGKVLSSSSSDLNLTPQRIFTSSGVCPHPEISISFSDFKQIFSYPTNPSDYLVSISLTISSKPETGIPYNPTSNFSLNSKNTNPVSILMEGTPRIIDGKKYMVFNSFLFKDAQITFDEVPENFAEGGNLKFSFRFTMEDNKIYEGTFEGKLPVPSTHYRQKTANKLQCLEEFNAYTNYSAQIALANFCEKNSDCFITDSVLLETCTPVSINKNAPNLAALQNAVDVYNDHFPNPYYYSNPSLHYCSEGVLSLPYCQSNRCRTQKYRPIE